MYIMKYLSIHWFTITPTPPPPLLSYYPYTPFTITPLLPRQCVGPTLLLPKPHDYPTPSPIAPLVQVLETSPGNLTWNSSPRRRWARMVVNI